MQPKVEITRQLNFSGWEGGGYNEKFNLGQSILIAGPNAEKLQVLFDHDVKKMRREKYHFMFILEVGYLLAQVSLRYHTHPQMGDVYSAKISLSEVEALTTRQVQDQQLPAAQTKVKVMVQRNYSSVEQMLALEDYAPDKVENYREEYKELLQAAITKAMQPPRNQRLFWGIPRKVVDQP